MNSLPFISVLVMSHNQETFIADTVKSVLSQEYDGELEFIFCDDCSTDSTFRIIQECVAEYKGNRRVVTHHCEQNGKVATNMNIAVGLARGDWYMRVDGDDILHPDRVRLTARAIILHPNATAISGKLQPFETIINPVINPKDADISYKAFSINNYATNQEPEGLEWWGCMMTMHRSIFDTFGPLPQECYVLDDTMFATRALMLGEFVIIENGTLLYYRRHAGNISSLRVTPNNIRSLIQSDRDTRDYYRRGIPCHRLILTEIESYCTSHPQYTPLLNCFRNRFAELRRQALFWNKSWSERIADAHISGPFWRKIPWAIRVLCPFTYALVRLMKKS